MNSSTLFLSQLIGPIGVIIALALIVNPKLYKELISKMDKEPLALYLGALMALVGGMAIVLTHNTWGTPAEILVSALGWLSVFKGVLLMTTTLPLKHIAKQFEPYRNAAAVVWLGLGGYLTYVGYFLN